MTEILDEFGSVFEAIGKIRDNKNDSELYVKVNMKPGIAPVAQKPRQVRTKLGLAHMVLTICLFYFVLTVRNFQF
jgi:hypothetical protein